MRGRSKVRVGVAAAVIAALAAGAGGSVAAAAEAPVAKGSMSKAASKRYVRQFVTSYLDSRIEQLRGPQGPSGPAGRSAPPPASAVTAVATRLDFRARQNTASTVLYDFVGLEVRADCSAQGEMTLKVRTSSKNSMLSFFGGDPDSGRTAGFDAGELGTTLPSFTAGGLPVLRFEPDFDVGDVIAIGGSDGTDLTQNVGNVQYTTADGRHVGIVYHAADRDAGGSGPLGGTSDCVFAGTALTS